LTKNAPSISASTSGRSRGAVGQEKDGQAEEERAAWCVTCDV
jgi:hypothetical protein